MAVTRSGAQASSRSYFQSSFGRSFLLWRAFFWNLKQSVRRFRLLLWGITRCDLLSRTSNVSTFASFGINTLIYFVVELLKCLVSRILIALQFQFWWRPFALRLAKLRRFDLLLPVLAYSVVATRLLGIITLRGVNKSLFTRPAMTLVLSILVLVLFVRTTLFVHVWPVALVNCLGIHRVITTLLSDLTNSFLFRLPLGLVRLVRNLDRDVSQRV